jgi:hypothetical protein
MRKRNNLEKYVRGQPPNTVITTFGAGLLVSKPYFLPYAVFPTDTERCLIIRISSARMENPKTSPSLLLGIPIILKSYSVIEWFDPALERLRSQPDSDQSCAAAHARRGESEKRTQLTAKPILLIREREGPNQKKFSAGMSASQRSTSGSPPISGFEGELSFLNLLCKLNTAKRRGLAGLQEGACSGWPSELNADQNIPKKPRFCFFTNG